VSQGDSWIERYLDLVPEKLTASDARNLLDLWDENLQALRQALETLAASKAGEEVAEDA
jgi:hypothetical protein